MNEGLFKTAVGGFRKSDVLAFIDNLDTQYKQKEQEYRKKITELTAQTRELTEKRDALTAELGQAFSDAQAVKDRCAELEQQTSGLGLENEQLRAQAEEKNRESDGLRMEILTLQQQLKTRGDEAGEKDRTIEELGEKVEELEEKARSYTVNEDKISRVLLEARAAADRMIEDAGQRAKQVQRQANDKVAALAGNVGSFKGSLAQMRAGTQEFADKALRMLAEIERAAAEVEDGFGALAGEPAQQGNADAEEEPGAEFSPSEASGEGVQGDAPFRGGETGREND